MPNLDEFLNKSNKVEPDLIIDGSFYCQFCSDSADEAYFYQKSGTLYWRPDCGHVSKIEKFSI